MSLKRGSDSYILISTFFYLYLDAQPVQIDYCRAAFRLFLSEDLLAVGAQTELA